MMLTKALLRGGMPFMIMGGIALLLYVQGKHADAKGTFTAGLIALCVGAASVIYNIDDWSLPKQSAVHFLAMIATVYPILLLSGWFPNTTPLDALIILGYFVSAGMALWLVMFALAKLFSW